MSMDELTIVAAQFDPHLFDAAYNLSKIEELIEQAGEDCDLIVFPEAALTGYCFSNEEETRRGAIERTGPELRRLQEIAAKRNLSIVVGAVEWAGKELYNTVFFLEPDGTLFSYYKSHLPFLGVDRFVQAGEEPAAVFETRFGPIGMIVCYELRFPEAARIAALRGARLLLQPTNLPEGGESHPDFLSRARACENRIFLVSCNRCGTERGFTFLGRSQIVDYNGTVLQETGEGEALISARIDLTEAENKDIISAPGERELYLLRDRRWDLYAPLSQRPQEHGFL